MRGHASLITDSVWPVWLKCWRSSRLEGLSGRLAIRPPSLIGLIVALLALTLWASPFSAMVRHGPDAHATMTQAAPDQVTHDCVTHENPAQAVCCGLACAPSLVLLPAPALPAGLRPATPSPDHTALGTSRTPDVLSPPPKA